MTGKQILTEVVNGFTQSVEFVVGLTDLFWVHAQIIYYLIGSLC